MVYVGEMFVTIPSSIWPYKAACHLFADSVNELHSFAQRLKLKRSWFQAHKRLNHYDLTTNKRRLAIREGATQVDRKTEVLHYRNRKGVHNAVSTKPDSNSN